MASRWVDSVPVLQPASSSPPTNDDIEAIIQMATSSRSLPDGRQCHPRDTRTQLFVGNLPYRVRWQDLKDLFRRAGTVLRTDVSLGPDNRSRGYGTVLLATAEDASRAVDMFNGYSWQTRILEVRPDRLPPDFDNPLGNAGAGLFTVNDSPNGVSMSSTSSVTAMSFREPSCNSFPSMPSTTPSNMDDCDYHLLLDGSPDPSSGGRNLFVGNLPFHCQWQDLKDLFRQAGKIIRADVALGQDGRSRGFGTVVYATEVDADRAVQMFNGYEYNGRPLKVHHDRFKQATISSSPPLPSFSQGPSTSNHMERKPTHTPVSIGYPLDVERVPGANPPLDMYAPHIPTSLPHSQPQPTSHLQEMRSSSTTAQHMQQSPSVDSFLPSLSNANHGSPEPLHLSPSQSPARSQHHAARPGRIVLPPPAPMFHPAHAHSPPLYPVSPLHHPMSPLHLPQSPLTPSYHTDPHMIAMTPHGLPPITPSMPPFNFLPQPSPHGHPASQSPVTMSTPMHGHPSAQHFMSTFSPGVAMSPGAFWGHPGGANPFINPAVGAPVHSSPGEFFGLHPASPQQALEEPTGYFPPVPPPVPPEGYFPLALDNRIMRDKDSVKKDVDRESSPSDGATDTGTRDGERRPSSSTDTSWHTGDSEVCFGNGRDPAKRENQERKGDDTEARATMLTGDHAISRTHSMSSAKKPPVLEVLGRSDSDPSQNHSREAEDVVNPISGAGSSR